MSTISIKEGDYVVYPAHGVGRLTSYENHNIAGHQVRLLVIAFDKERMTLRLPENKIDSAGLRPLATKVEISDALEILKIKIRTKRTMWSRRAQEYEAKINSGNLVSIAEVLRELFKTNKESDQSYSERQIYQAALERFIREVSIVEQIDEQETLLHIENILLNVA
jgi:CarD family transcriptional regulator